MTYEELKQAAAVISHAKEMKYYVSKERFALAALTQFGIDDEKSVDIMYGFFCRMPDIVQRIAASEKLTEKYLPKAIEIAEAAYSLRGGDGYDSTVPGIEDKWRYNEKDRRRYFYRTKDGQDGHADFSLKQRSDIISLARFVERTDFEITGVAHHLGQLDTDEVDSNRNRIMVDYYEGDIYFLFGDPTDRIFYDWYSHGDDAGVYVATEKGWRKLLYTPGRGYVGKDGELEFVDDKHFYSDYMLEASGKKFQYVGNIHHSLSVLVERRKKQKEED